MADVQYGKPNPSDGFPVRAADVSGVGTAYAEEVVPVGYDAATLSYYKFAVDTNGNLQVGIAGGGTVLPVGQIQVGGTSGTSTNVGFGAGQLAVPVNVIAGGAGGGLSQLQVWGSGTAGTWTDVGFGTASGTANLSVPVVFAGTATVAGTVTTIPTGTQSVAQVTSPWVVGGTTTTVPSGTQSVTGTVAVTQVTSPWVVSGTTTAIPSGTTTVVGTVTDVPTGTQSVAQVTSPWVVGGTTTTVPSGTQTIAGTVVTSGTGIVVGVEGIQVWGPGALGTWTNVGYGTSGTVVNLNVPVAIESGTVAVTQSTSPWVVGGTTTSVPSGTQSVAQTGSPWGVSGTVTAVESGTWSVTVSGTATTAPTGTQSVAQTGAPWGVTVSTEVSGGATVFSNINQGTVGTAIKSSAASLYGYYLGNNGTSSLFVRLYNVTTAPTSTDTPLIRAYIPGSAAANVALTVPVAFTTGLGIRATTAVADNDTTAPASNQAIVNIYYA